MAKSDRAPLLLALERVGQAQGVDDHVGHVDLLAELGRAPIAAVWLAPPLVDRLEAVARGVGARRVASASRSVALVYWVSSCPGRVQDRACGPSSRSVVNCWRSRRLSPIWNTET